MKIARIAACVVVIIGCAVAYRYNPKPIEVLRTPVIAEKETASFGQGARILFAGDIMLDRTMRAVAARNGGAEDGGYDFIFSCIGDRLKTYDAVVANLEGPVTNNPSASASTTPGQPSNTQFTFDPIALGALKRAGVSAVSLANNHIYDFGGDGIRQTETNLDAAGIAHFGSPLGNNSTVILPHSLPVVLVGYNQFFGTASTTLADIRDSAGKGFVVVFSHWGDEYVPATDEVKALAHQFIDAGAGLVIGSHPHVVQDSETYKGAPIYYSLGNFVFDQYFNDAVRTGLAVGVDIEKTWHGYDVTKVTEMETHLERDGRTCFAE